MRYLIARVAVEIAVAIFPPFAASWNLVLRCLFLVCPFLAFLFGTLSGSNAPYLFFKALAWTRLPLPHLPFSSLFLIFFFLKTRSHYTYNWDWPQISKFAVYAEWPPAWGVLPKCCFAVCSTAPSSGSVPPPLLLPTVDWLWSPESTPPLSFIPTSVWLYLSIYLFIGWRGIRYQDGLEYAP